MAGFYLMHRGWQDHFIFRNEAFSRRDAFVWLIENANFTDGGRVRTQLGFVELKRGQLSFSIRYLARAWSWDDAKVRRFLKSMQREEIIDAATDAGQTIITICNYDKYQAPFEQPDAPDGASSTHHKSIADAATDANRKEGKEWKESSLSDDDEILGFVGDIARAADLASTDPGRIIEQNLIVKAWVAAGASRDLIIDVVERTLAKARNKPNSLRYFDRAVMEALSGSPSRAPAHGSDLVPGSKVTRADMAMAEDILKRKALREAAERNQKS